MRGPMSCAMHDVVPTGTGADAPVPVDSPKDGTGARERATAGRHKETL
ncbi:hypothetical protein BDO18943_01724 [Burkholderia dolosa]|nr:hypothetical protein BDO18943_01724 [Burkholderia dolosa]